MATKSDKRFTITDDNLNYLNSLADEWGCTTKQALNYLLFNLRTKQPETAPISSVTPIVQSIVHEPHVGFVSIPEIEMHQEPIPLNSHTPTIEDDVISRMALLIEEF